MLIENVNFILDTYLKFILSVLLTVLLAKILF